MAFVSIAGQIHKGEFTMVLRLISAALFALVISGSLAQAQCSCNSSPAVAAPVYSQPASGYVANYAPAYETPVSYTSYYASAPAPVSYATYYAAAPAYAAPVLYASYYAPAVTAPVPYVSYYAPYTSYYTPYVAAAPVVAYPAYYGRVRWRIY
jgi:hypothetical protein